MAYQSDESGQDEVYVRPFPEVQANQVTISNAGGFDPVWSRDGTELFYLEPGTPNRLVAVSFDTGADEGVFEERHVLMDWPYSTAAPGRNYDVAPDGRFIAVKVEAAPGSGSTAEPTVVLNFDEELKRQVPTN